MIPTRRCATLTSSPPGAPRGGRSRSTLGQQTTTRPPHRIGTPVSVAGTTRSGEFGTGRLHGSRKRRRIAQTDALSVVPREPTTHPEPAASVEIPQYTL